MKKRKRILLIALLVAMLAIFACIVLRQDESEPAYQGRKLSEWLDDYTLWFHPNQGPGKKDETADDAVRHMGTNAIPTLLRMLGATDSPVKKLAIWSADLAKSHGYYNFRNIKILSHPAIVQHLQAADAFGALGADARNAVPKLMEVLKRPPTDDGAEIVAATLGAIGPSASNAVPLLLWAVSRNGNVSYSSLRALGEIHAQPAQVAPVLVKLLKNPDVNVRRMAAKDLQAFGADARPAVPALIEALTDQDEYVRKYAAQAISAIDPEAAAKTSVK